MQADPHPGNLIRTPDGRLAILDFGLVTEIDDNIKFGMVEAISHLIHRDYEAIVEDFVTLQFIDPGTNLRPILPVLAKVSTAVHHSPARQTFHQLQHYMLVMICSTVAWCQDTDSLVIRHVVTPI